MNEILSVENIRKEFAVENKEKLKAVNNVSLSLKNGECLAVVGESGCGKSTLAKLITHIEEPTAGKITFNGNDITHIKRKDLREYRKNVQMIFQHPIGVFSPRMKIGTFLMEPWINFEKKSKKDAKAEAIYALERVHLNESYFSKYPHQLSGGELQRVSIARAIALHPKVLICDEATSALDVSIQKEIIDLLKEHQKETGFAILFICHDLALVENFCDRVAVMYLGKIVEDLKAKALRKNAKHPYTKALLESVFNVHDDKREIQVLHGEPPSPINLPKGCAFCKRCSFAIDKCHNEEPKLKEIANGHSAACHILN